MSNEVIYKNSKLLVGDNIFRTPKRTYRIGDIEKVNIKRPLFWLTLPLAVGSFLMLSEFGAYLYQIEKQIFFGTFILLPLISWNIGTLSVTSKSYTNDDAITWFMPSLKKARDALEHQIIYQSHNPKTQPGGK